MEQLLSAPAAENIVDLFYEDYFIYEKAKIRINDIIDSWSGLCSQAQQRRNERYIDLNIEELRKSGSILPDETFIPQRVIDINMSRELPEFLSFLKQSNRLAIFTCVSDPNIQTDNLEKDFTKGLTYEGWYKDFKKMIDGAQLHGWDSVEVVYDESKPLHVGFEHVDCASGACPVDFKR